MIKPLSDNTPLSVYDFNIAPNDAVTEHITAPRCKQIVKAWAVATLRRNDGKIEMQLGNVGNISFNLGYENIVNIPVYANMNNVHIVKGGFQFDNKQLTGNTLKLCISMRKQKTSIKYITVKLYVQYEY